MTRAAHTVLCVQSVCARLCNVTPVQAEKHITGWCKAILNNQQSGIKSPDWQYWQSVGVAVAVKVVGATWVAAGWGCLEAADLGSE
jgi:hypothetical protein